MITDAFTRLSNNQAITTTALSTDGIDTADRLGRSGASMLGIKERAGSFADGGLCAVFTVTQSFANTANDETVRFQMVALPTEDGADVTTTVAGGYLTSPVFLPTGTVVTSTASGALATGTHYYVVRDQNDPTSKEFKLSTTPDVGGAVTSAASTLTAFRQVIADSGEVPIGRLRLGLTNATTGAPDGQRPGDQVRIYSNPLPSSQLAALPRYIYARYFVSSTMSAGRITADVGISVPDNRGIYYASGYEIK